MTLANKLGQMMFLTLLLASCGRKGDVSMFKSSASGTEEFKADTEAVFGSLPKQLGRLYAQSVMVSATRRDVNDIDLADFNAITIMREFRKPKPDLKRLRQALDQNPQVLDSLKKNAKGDFSDQDKIMDDAFEMVPFGVAEAIGPLYSLVKPGTKAILMMSELNDPSSPFSQTGMQNGAKQTLIEFNRQAFDRTENYSQLGELYHSNPLAKEFVDNHVTPWVGVGPSDLPILANQDVADDSGLNDFVKHGATWSKEEQEAFLKKMSDTIREENKELQKNIVTQLSAEIENLKNPPKTKDQVAYENTKANLEGIEIGMHSVKILGQIFDPKVAEAVDKIGFPAMKITYKVVDMALGDLALRAGTMDVLGLVSDLLGALLGGPSPEQMIMDMIQDLQEQMADFRAAMETRLSRIDDKLNILMINMDQHFSETRQAFEEHRKDLRNLKLQVATLSRETRALNYSQNRFMQEGFLQDVTSSVNSCIEYRKNYKDTKTPEYKSVVKSCIEKMWDCATHRASQALNSGLQNDALDFKSPDIYTDILNRLNANSKFDPYNQINFLLGSYSALESPSLVSDPTEMVNPKLWATCSSVYKRVASENFAIFKEFIKESDSKKNSYYQIQKIIEAGEQANQAMQNALFYGPDDKEEVRMLDDNKLAGFKKVYENRIAALESAIAEKRVEIERENFGGLDSLGGVTQTPEFTGGVGASTLLNAMVPSNVRFCDSVAPETAASWKADKSSFNLDLLVESRQALLAKLPQSVLVAAKSGLGSMQWCVYEIAWADYQKSYAPTERAQINRGLAVGQDPMTKGILAMINMPSIYQFYPANKVMDVHQYRHKGIWEVHIGFPVVRLKGSWVAGGVVTPIIQSSTKANTPTHIGDANNWFVFGVYAGPNGFSQHAELGKNVQDVWKTNIEPQMQTSGADILEQISVVEAAVNERIRTNQGGIREMVLANAVAPGSPLAIASAQLEALVAILDVGLRFSMPQSRNKDGEVDALIYGPEGLYHAAQLQTIAGTSEAALFDGTVTNVLKQRFEKFQEYALKMHASKTEAHPIIANSIEDLRLLEAMLKTKS